MHDEKGVVAEVTKGLCQKAEVPVPEELVGADGNVGVKKDFQNMPCANKRWIRERPKS